MADPITIYKDSSNPQSIWNERLRRAMDGDKSVTTDAEKPHEFHVERRDEVAKVASQQLVAVGTLKGAYEKQATSSDPTQMQQSVDRQEKLQNCDKVIQLLKGVIEAYNNPSYKNSAESTKATAPTAPSKVDVPTPQGPTTVATPAREAQTFRK